MSDIRVITIKDDGYVEWTPERMHVPLTPLEEAIQRFMLCLMTTAGSMIDAPSWGGSALRLYLKNRARTKEETQKRVADVLYQTQSSLLNTEPASDSYAINGVILMGLTREERGFTVEVRLSFANATSITIRVPGQDNVSI